MREDRGDDRKTADSGAKGESGSAPFSRSGSGAAYDPEGNWAAERARNGPSGGSSGIEGAPSGAGDGGFGPEGGFSGAAGQEAADVLGEVNGDDSALVDEAQERGARRADRRFTGGEGADEPDSPG